MKRRITIENRAGSRRTLRTGGVLCLCMLVTALGGCDTFDFYGLLSARASQPGGTLVINPVSVTVSLNGICTFTASGGVPPYAFAVTSGTGTIDSNTGIYRAPAAPSSAVVQVSDGAGGVAEAHVAAL